MNDSSGNGSANPEAADEGLLEASRVAELALEDVDADAAWRKAADDPARAAADVEHRALAGDELHDVPMTRALPVALQEDSAVVCAVVVVGGEDRVAQHPQLAERAQAGHADTQHAGARASMFARLVDEGDLANAPALGERLDEDLLQDVEIAARNALLAQHRAAIQSKSARQIANRHVQPAREQGIQEPAERVAIQPHRRASARHVAGRDGHVGGVALVPEPLDECRRVRQIGIHGQQVVARGAREAGDERAAVSRLDLFDDARAMTAGRLAHQLVGVPREEEDLVPDAQALQDVVQLREQDREVLPFVERRNEHAQIDGLGRDCCAVLRTRVSGGAIRKSRPGWHRCPIIG